MSRTSPRTASVYTRIDPQTKEQAENVLNQLGISMSNAIGLFLKQIVLQHRIPFEVKLPLAQPTAIGGMTKEQISFELQKGIEDIEKGRVISAEEVESEMSRIYDI